MIALISVKWTWKCAVVNDSSDGPEMYYKVFIGRFPGFSKLLRFGSDGVAMCLLGRFPFCLVTVGSRGDILKLSCRCFSW